jgi:hypothetical protein
MYDGLIDNCTAGGIGIGASNTLVQGWRIASCGNGVLSCINIIGSTPLAGITIQDNKLGATDIAVMNTTNKFAIDIGTLFTSTLTSFVVTGNTCQGRGGPIDPNFVTVLNASFALSGANANIVVEGNPGLNPLVGINQPAAPAAATTTYTYNPFFCTANVQVLSDGTHPITAIKVNGPNGINTIAVPTPMQLVGITLQLQATCGFIPVFSAGTCTTLWTPC